MYMNTAESHTGHLSVPGGTLAYDVVGHGPPLVFIHAAIADRRMWDREVMSYPRSFRVIRYDVRGFGESTPAVSEYSNANDLADILDELGINTATLVGASQGGLIALDFAHRYPGRVHRLALVGSGLELFGPEDDSQVRGALKDLQDRWGRALSDWKEGRTEEAVQGVLTTFGSSQRGPSRVQVESLIRRNLEEIVTDRSARHALCSVTPADLSKLTVPTLVILGTKDHPAIRWAAHKLAETVPGSRCRDIIGADHLPNLSTPIEFDAALREFLTR